MPCLSLPGSAALLSDAVFFKHFFAETVRVGNRKEKSRTSDTAIDASANICPASQTGSRSSRVLRREWVPANSGAGSNSG
jgi:hypothetical protein